MALLKQKFFALYIFYMPYFIFYNLCIKEHPPAHSNNEHSLRKILIIGRAIANRTTKHYGCQVVDQIEFVLIALLKDRSLLKARDRSQEISHEAESFALRPPM